MTRFRLVLILILLAPFPLLAQTGSLTGVALDSVGNTVAGATISACNPGAVGIPCSPVVASTTSNGQGAFSMVVPVGTYVVTVFRLGIVATSSTVVVAPSNITVANTVTYTGNVTIGPGNLTVSGTGTFTNIDNSLEVSSFATGGVGTQASPWTSPSGTAGFNEAFTQAGTANGGIARLHAKAGWYQLTTCVNATANIATSLGNSAPAAAFIIQGDGPGKTVVVGQTGGCVFDTSGREGQFFGFTITQAASTPSTLGILQARVGTGQSNFVSGSVLENMVIDLPSVTGANGGNGTIGVYAYSSEAGRYINNVISANHPYIFTSNNVFSITSAYQTLASTLRFVSQNVLTKGSCTLYSDATYSAGECIMLQGHAANTTIDGVAGECAGASVSSSNPYIRILAPTAPDGAGDPTPGLRMVNIQAECATSGALLINSGNLTNTIIQGSFKNLTAVPIISLAAAAAALVDPLIDIQIGDASKIEPLVSDGGVTTNGITGGIIYLGAQATISFTGATPCNNVRVYADFNSPTITCANSNGIAVGGTLTGEMQAGDNYYFKASGTANYNTNTSFAWNVQGSQKLGIGTTLAQFGATPTPSSAGLQDLGTTALPFGNLWLGGVATNNFKIQPAATTGARIITVADPVSPTTVGLPLLIASGTSTLTANATLGAATCQAAITSSATGAAATDSIEWSFATAPATGDAISPVAAYATANNVNFIRCNPTAAAQNVTAIVINWRVIR